MVNIGTEERPSTLPAENGQGAFEDFLMHLAIAFVNILPENIDQEINRALAMTGMFTGVDRAYVMTYDFCDRTVANTHEWCAEGIEPMIHELQCVPMEGLEECWLDVHLRGDIVHVPSVKDLPASGALRQLLEPQGISTLVAVPMTYRDTCLGFVGFDAVRHHLDWSTEQLTLVRMLGELFTNAEMSRRRTQAIHEQQTKHKRMSLLLQKAVDATGVAVWELERNAKTVNMISGWDRMVGLAWDGREIGLDEFCSRVHPEDIPSVEAVVSGLEGDHTSSKKLEFRLRGKRGEWRYLSAWWVEEPSGSRDQVKLYGGTMDVSDTHLRTESQILLNRISSRFVDLESHDDAIAASMPEIAQFCLAANAELIPIGALLQMPCDMESELPAGIRASLARRWNPADSSIGMLYHLSSGDSIVTGKDGSIQSLRADANEEIQFAQGSILWVPLMVGGETKAVIAVTNPDLGPHTSQPHLDFLHSCAEVIAGALGRAEAERILLENGKRKQVILNSLKEVIFLTDPKGRVTFINQAGADFCGQSAASVIGRPVSESLASLIPKCLGFFPTTFEGFGDTEESMICFTERGMQTRTLQLARRLLMDDTGTITGMLGMITDITEQQAWESTLISQKIQAESSSKEKSLYISKLSHELRTPMHGVLGMLELMIKSGNLDTANHELAKAARASGNDLTRLFDDILQIAKMECGVVKIDAKEIEIRKMMHETLRPFHEDCQALGIDLDLYISNDVHEIVLVDDLRLRQIINNIVSNAIKYTDSGFVKISIRPVENPSDMPADGTKRIGFTVEDSGIGIAEEDMGLLFTPFFTINSNRSREVEGSGLGLPITRELVKLLNGEISVDSVIGKGTRVTVILPLSASEHPSVAGDNHTLAGKAFDELKGLRVLIAEDNVINRMILTEHLGAMGCIVTSAGNGMEAVRASAEQSFDFVIMDLSMPVMHGYEAAKQIMARARTANGGPIIIGCTADASESAASRCLEAGMRSVIVKPFTRSELALAIKSIMTGDNHHFRQPAEADPFSHSEQIPPAFNESVFESLEASISSDQNILAGIIDLFHQDSLRKIQDLLAAMKEGDAARCSATAHSLKGGAASVGADELAHYSSLIEEASVMHGGKPGVGMVLPDGLREKLLSAHADYFRLVNNRRNAIDAPQHTAS